LALELATTDLSGASCQHMSKLLAQNHSAKISAKSLLRLLKGAGIANPHSHKGPRRRRCRRRMPQQGMLVQTDATPLAWFENRGPAATLHGFIDDATSEVLALHFRPTEDSTGYMTAMRFTLEHSGCPVSLYADRHAIFRVNQGNPLSIEEQLEGRIVPFPVWQGASGARHPHHLRAFTAGQGPY
ncbi:MAG: integrase, partial [Bacillota bacterium]|nr:integrase [Bacillota bacterium]